MKTTLTTIYIVRHGESESNAGINMHADGPRTLGSSLTDKGLEQAHGVAKELENVSFDKIFSSDLTRTVQTAEIIALQRSIVIDTTDTIRERSFSHYAKHFPEKSEEELTEEIRKNLHKLEEKAKIAYKHTPEMESVDEGATRLLTFLRQIAIAYAGKTVLIVNHGNNMRALLTKLGFATFNELPSGSVKNTAYIVLESDGIDFFIKETKGIEKQLNAERIF